MRSLAIASARLSSRSSMVSRTPGKPLVAHRPFSWFLSPSLISSCSRQAIRLSGGLATTLSEGKVPSNLRVPPGDPSHKAASCLSLKSWLFYPQIDVITIGQNPGSLTAGLIQRLATLFLARPGAQNPGLFASPLHLQLASLFDHSSCTV